MMKMVEEARDKAYHAARVAIRRVVPGLDKFIPREHVEAYVTEARLSSLEAVVCSLAAKESGYPGSHEDKVACELRDYWEEIAKNLSDGAVV